MSEPTFCQCDLCKEVQKKVKYPKCDICGEHHDNRLNCPPANISAYEYHKDFHKQQSLKAKNENKVVIITATQRKVKPNECEYHLELDNGKYIVYIKNKPYEFKALRHGEEWQDLVGNNLMFSLVAELDGAKKKITEAIRMLNYPGSYSANHIKKYLEETE